MTKKDSNRAAQAIAAAFYEQNLTRLQQIEAVTDQLALMFSEDNSRFDYGRFRKAVYEAVGEFAEANS